MNIRIDEDTRRELKEFAEQIGIPATSLVNASIRQMLRSGEARFTPSLEPTSYLEKIIEEGETDFKAGRNITQVTNKAELEEYLKTLW